MKRTFAHHAVYVLDAAGKPVAHTAHPSLQSAAEHAKPHGKKRAFVGTVITESINDFPKGRR